MMNKGLYIHFPFCEKKCNYCDFYSLANSSKKTEYITALIREIKACERTKFDTVYFGGGTPSLMNGIELSGILDAIYSAFEIDQNAEITLEANPMSVVDSQKLPDFRSLGINRLSLGVQSFNDTELKALGRAHTTQDAIRTVKMAREAGFDNISLDLMFAIPHQNIQSFESSLDTATALEVEHISAYALSIEEKTVFGVRQRRGESLYLPDEDSEAKMYFVACEKLKNAGYEHYEVSNFAKSGRRSRHNMKYWQCKEYLGIGASAHSYFNGIRYSMPSDISQFCKGAQRVDCYENTPLDRAEEFVFLSLRLSDGLNIKLLESDHHCHITPEFEKTVLSLKEQGYCNYDGERVWLTEKGFFVSNTVIVKILDKLEM